MKGRILSMVLIAAAAFAGATTANAQNRERDRGPRQFAENANIVLRADRAYIFYRTPNRSTFRFLRESSPEEVAAHAARRAEAFARARERGERRAASWDRDRALCPPRTADRRCQEPRPTIPTEETFEFPSIYEGNLVGNDHRPRLIHQEAWSGWLIAVDPGTYALYGEVTLTANGTGGICYCMGSVRFEARAGQITDMGEIVAAPSDQQGVVELQNFRLGHFVTVAPWNASMRSPAQFANLQVVPAELRAAGKVANHFGIPITRLAPIEGVLGYERDRVIDLRTGATVEGSNLR